MPVCDISHNKIRDGEVKENIKRIISEHNAELLCGGRRAVFDVADHTGDQVNGEHNAADAEQADAVGMAAEGEKNGKHKPVLKKLNGNSACGGHKGKANGH